MGREVIEKIPPNNSENIENDEAEFSIPELKLLNLIAEIIVNISIRESHEKSD